MKPKLATCAVESTAEHPGRLRDRPARADDPIIGGAAAGWPDRGRPYTVRRAVGPRRARSEAGPNSATVDQRGAEPDFPAARERARQRKSSHHLARARHTPEPGALEGYGRGPFGRRRDP